MGAAASFCVGVLLEEEPMHLRKLEGIMKEEKDCVETLKQNLKISVKVKSWSKLGLPAGP